MGNMSTKQANRTTNFNGGKGRASLELLSYCAAKDKGRCSRGQVRSRGIALPNLLFVSFLADDFVYVGQTMYSKIRLEESSKSTRKALEEHTVDES